MSELLEVEEIEIEMEVLNEYGEVIYSGEFDEYLAMNNYDEELEEILNCVQSGYSMKWTNENGEMFTIWTNLY
jgi:hypothetical protein